MIGSTLAHYEIIDLLGKGGMGEVYRARDTKLGRDVAIKLLPREVAADPERLARFRREAKLLASLNHPNVGALYGIEESDDQVFLVMELAEGEDLSQRLQRGAMPVDEALAVALQIAEGLEAAHAKNIVHRDLKPANVMYDPTGRVKLLDFGLARAYHGDEASGDPMTSPTITAAMTQQGMVLGTAAYMSPEQARGKSVDRQSDIWAFGVVLYEMLTAHRVFAGETISDSIGAILHKEPEWPRLPADTPPQVRQLLARCLERDRQERLHDIADARVALIEARKDPTGSRLGLSGDPATRGSGLRSTFLAGIALIAGVTIGATLAAGPFRAETEAPYRVLDLGVEFEPGDDQDQGIQAAISPGGDAVAYVNGGKLWLQRLDEYVPRPVAETDEAFLPFWSPDGSQLGWFREGRLWRAPVGGGRAVALCEIKGQIAAGIGAHWTDDGRVLFTTGSSGIRYVSERGGQVQELVPPGEGYGDLHEPHALPRGKGVLFVSHPAERGPSVLELWRNGQRRVLFEAPTGARLWCPSYDPAGYVLFRWTRSEATSGLWAVEFDIGSGEARGEPFLVEADASEATVARDGTLAFVMNPRRSNQRTLVRVGFNGEQLETLSGSHAGGLEFALSADGSQIAFTAYPLDGEERDQLWVRDLVRGTELQLTSFADRWVVRPQWIAGERELTFIAPPTSAPAGAPTFRMPADGSRPPEQIADGPVQLTPLAGHGLRVTGPRLSPLINPDMDSMEIWLEPLDDPEARRKVLGSEGSTFPAGFSPDGNYLMYYERRGGRDSIYLTRFPEFTGRWKVSIGDEVWSEGFSPDGSWIYYASRREVFRVSFEDGPTPRLGRPEKVGTLPDMATGSIQIHPDGDSYVTAVTLAADPSDTRRRTIKVVQNWTANLGR